ncbi:SDR family oxidoreductase [Oceanispirochaeta sp.]|jgi:NAD(P)-dependent dehydrogenase (short-subunit alcohol dehydrogenase family)|uniref:SDR family NAD(P)-dependent oxidoreductase n=1 Tax=Oceanispirochaeta sp. TaxID=2035350 RepID=UPI00261C6D4C|nr:SDR family oxidoreductase [Oceanispirochaeta sp.]MDA3955793.1 SDR family oxidoreductase [Oceanispirochaeta sp.]
MEEKNLKFDFSDKNVVITGATKGIGRDIALAFAEAGSNVGITGRNETELAELKSEITALGVNCLSSRSDLSDADDCLRMAGYFNSEFPKIDILINNAGISFPELLTEMNVDHWNTTLNVNLRAPALITKVISSGMIERKAGVIINISSNACMAGIEEHAAYCASKFGLDGLTKVMAVEFGPFNIRVNAIAPTVVLTPMGVQVWGDPVKADPVKAKIPMGRFINTNEVTSVALFLASKEAAMIHGETLLIDGGVNAKLY